MNDLQKHELFELEVLKYLSQNRFLTPLIFGGETCLRLCFGLKRYSVDLDFWAKDTISNEYFHKLKKVIENVYIIKDYHEKYFSFLIELSSLKYSRKLKLEIRKNPEKHKETEVSIAFSSLTNIQIRLQTYTLNQLWINKIEAFLARKAIRDAYDLEFIYKKRSSYINNLCISIKNRLISYLDSFTEKDCKVSLGSLLEAEERKYYNKYGFKILKNALL